MEPHVDRPKKNSRLESYLLRKMTPSSYESVRYYEPCIVRQGKAIQYQTAVVTEAGLFAVDEPPRHLQEVVRLLDIISIERIHDVIEFLREPLRDRVQHVRIEYRPSQPAAAARALSPDSLSSELAAAAEPSRGMTRSQSALPAYHRSPSVRADLPERSRSVLDRPRADGRVVKKRSTSLDDVRGARKLPEPKVYHVYLLQEGSPFQQHLRTAWMSRLISRTQAIEQSDPESPTRIDPQQLDQLFEDLRADLLTSSDLEQKFNLVRELKIGAAEYKRVRRLFWKGVFIYRPTPEQPP
ncbi:uncharacterized protein LOC119091468 [Pollicipes pollicipes]|uniref:uncharacterized protein LOC119091468 n=1 Tax=Pollicipes pollicipes TaxID=41117 RepID=UPI001884EEB1|nr:uncharacterized protein LOC119091468 [Pollicipes pollicipes]